MKHEYNEDPEAKERFEKMATTLFRAPKPTAKPAQKKPGTKKVTKEGRDAV